MKFSITSAPEHVALAFNMLVDLFAETPAVTPEELTELTRLDPYEVRRRWWIEITTDLNGASWCRPHGILAEAVEATKLGKANIND